MPVPNGSNKTRSVSTLIEKLEIREGEICMLKVGGDTLHI